MKKLISKIEWDDLRAFMTLINVILIMQFGITVAWLGLSIAVFGVAKDITERKKFSSYAIHISNAILNIYFIFFAQQGGK